MVDGAIFNSYDSGSHFKKSNFKWLMKKSSYIFVTELRLQIRLSMQARYIGIHF